MGISDSSSSDGGDIFDSCASVNCQCSRCVRVRASERCEVCKRAVAANASHWIVHLYRWQSTKKRERRTFEIFACSGEDFRLFLFSLNLSSPRRCHFGGAAVEIGTEDVIIERMICQCLFAPLWYGVDPLAFEGDQFYSRPDAAVHIIHAIFICNSQFLLHSFLWIRRAIEMVIIFCLQFENTLCVFSRMLRVRWRCRVELPRRWESFFAFPSEHLFRRSHASADRMDRTAVANKRTIPGQPRRPGWKCKVKATRSGESRERKCWSLRAGSIAPNDWAFIPSLFSVRSVSVVYRLLIHFMACFSLPRIIVITYYYFCYCFSILRELCPPPGGVGGGARMFCWTPCCCRCRSSAVENKMPDIRSNI